MQVSVERVYLSAVHIKYEIKHASQSLADIIDRELLYRKQLVERLLYVAVTVRVVGKYTHKPEQ